jgi:hypothetical protein
VNPSETWTRHGMDPHPAAAHLAHHALRGDVSPGAWPFVEGRIFGVVACAVGHAGQLRDVLRISRDVHLLVAVALAAGDA